MDNLIEAGFGLFFCCFSLLFVEYIPIIKGLSASVEGLYW